MFTLTNQQAEDLTGIKAPDYLDRQATVPTAKTGAPNHQGDVMICPIDTVAKTGRKELLNSGEGRKVVEGEADRNSHVLNSSGPESFYIDTSNRSDFDYGELFVSPGETVLLTHTAEHYAMLVPAGSWLLRGQKDAATMRRVAD